MTTFLVIALCVALVIWYWAPGALQSLIDWVKEKIEEKRSGKD